ncbi:hypothetical protein CC78DRAFT_545726 [Lojkania enalia]|uniref:Uncharacterized protein n=1 Tax=Lojkania enalia TaxID=147567 RepID=A0A9P4N4X2_9PLEO|nr:hypothetical protein CC78DRAFT_545726 [Didymosphaeria enalia]
MTKNMVSSKTPNHEPSMASGQQADLPPKPPVASSTAAVQGANLPPRPVKKPAGSGRRANLSGILTREQSGPKVRGPRIPHYGPGPLPQSSPGTFGLPVAPSLPNVQGGPFGLGAYQLPMAHPYAAGPPYIQGSSELILHPPMTTGFGQPPPQPFYHAGPIVGGDPRAPISYPPPSPSKPNNHNWLPLIDASTETPGHPQGVYDERHVRRCLEQGLDGMRIMLNKVTRRARFSEKLVVDLPAPMVAALDDFPDLKCVYMTLKTAARDAQAQAGEVPSSSR